MTEAEVEKTIREYIVAQFLQGEGEGLTSSSPLLEWGVLESLKLLSLLGFLDSTFGIEVPDDALQQDNFASLSAITRLVVGLRAAANVG